MPDVLAQLTATEMSSIALQDKTIELQTALLERDVLITEKEALVQELQRELALKSQLTETAEAVVQVMEVLALLYGCSATCVREHCLHISMCMAM